MAKSILDIIIRLSKQGGADKETITGLVKVKSAMMEGAAAAGTLVAAGYAIKKAFDATVGTMVEYADQVRSISQSTGLGAEESSRLIQVLDDMKISYEDLQKVVQKNGDQFDYSIAGLAKMSDEYRSLTDAQDKANFMQERFGKNWVSFVEAMEQGGEKLRKAGEAINEGLVLDEAALREAREYQENLDELNDKTQGWAVSIGSDLVPALNDQIDVEARVQQLMAEGTNHYTARAKATQEAIILHNLETSAAEKANAARWNGLASLYATTTATEDLSSLIQINYSEILSSTQKISEAEMAYSDAVKEVNSDINLSTEERKTKLDELAAKHSETMTKIISDNLLQKLSVGELTQAEFEMYTKYQVATGQITSDAAAQALALNAVTQAAADGKIRFEDLQRAIDLLQSKTITLTIDQVTNIIRRDYTESVADNRAGYATGTKGWETVPAGFPNDTYPIGLTSGEKFAVIPAGGGMGGGAAVGGGGGGVVVVNVNISSVISNADRESAQNVLMPFIMKGIRQGQAQGVIK